MFLTSENETESDGAARALKRISQTEMMYPEQEFTSWSLQTNFGRYSFASGYVKAKNILDLGCGSGYGSSFLSKSGRADHVIGGYVSENAIKTASRMFQNNKLSFVWLDATALPFRNDSFDIVVSLEVIEHLVEYRIYLQEVKRVLRSYGTFICSTPNKGFVSWDPRRPGSVYHKKEFNISEFKEILSEYIPKLTMFGQDYWKSAERGFSRVIDMMS